MEKTNIKIFSGSASIGLAEKISTYLHLPLGKIQTGKFADGEISIKICENVRGTDVYIIQSTSHDVNYNLMELLIMIDAFKRASATRITAVIPYFGYARQDRKDRPRVPITAKLVANLLTIAGASRILTMDLHADQIQGFFDIPVDHLFAAPIFIEYLERNSDGKDYVIVSPDTGSVPRARGLAKRLNAGLAIVDKRRPQPNISEVVNIIGEVSGKDLIIYDDIIDTGGTLVNAAEKLKEKGARSIWVCCTHAILSNNAEEKLKNSTIEKVIFSDTIALSNAAAKLEEMVILSVNELLGEAILRIHNNDSVSSLFV
ncbi:ribose-phosphate pyrophosphokinase [Candidatus Dependentiae bacterium]|nr:ribose-phosphate pyrophosphokinase [Candidatus Dependentiae bacterium]